MKHVEERSPDESTRKWKRKLVRDAIEVLGNRMRVKNLWERVMKAVNSTKKTKKDKKNKKDKKKSKKKQVSIHRGPLI